MTFIANQMSLNRHLSLATNYLDVEGLVNCLSELVAIPSVTGSLEEGHAQHWFAERLEESGFQIDLWSIDLSTTTTNQDFPGMEAHRSEAWGLVGSWGGDEGPTLVLNGHIDVVPPGALAQWQDGAPFSGRVADGRVYGRGTCDMKGGLICNLFAVRAIQAAGIQLKGKVLLESVVSEEDGGLGTFATLLRGYRGDAAIIPEPTELQIVPACAGSLVFRLHLKGLSAHASVRSVGVSTIDKFWQVWRALTALEARRNQSSHPLMSKFKLPYPLSIGRLQAGDWPSSVPDQLIAEGRLGVALGELPDKARSEFEATLAEACQQDFWLREYPIEVEWFGGQFASGQIPVDHPLVRIVSEAHQQLHGAKPEIHGAPYGSDLRLMTDLGRVPTLHYGPGSVTKAHAPNEYVPILELVMATQTLIATILQFCGYEEQVECIKD